MASKESNKSNQKFFIDDWLENPEFSWLRKDRDLTKARCAICNKTFQLLIVGKSAVTDHGKGQKHKKAVESRNAFFKPKIQSSAQPGISKVLENKDSSGEQQSTVELFIANTEVVKAEIIWVLKSVVSGFSYRSSDSTPSLFSSMFPDSEIAKRFKMGKTKANYIATHGLAPYFKGLLMGKLNKSICMSHSFDESLNSTTQTSEMDLYVRFWDSDKMNVDVRFLGSSFLGHAKHDDLQLHYNNITKDLDPKSLYQLSMDGPNVNKKFFKAIVKERETSSFHQLIDIGTCSLHVVHGSFKTAFEKSGWKIKQVLKGSFQLFKDSPAKREDYVVCTGSK